MASPAALRKGVTNERQGEKGLSPEASRGSEEIAGAPTLKIVKVRRQNPRGLDF